MRQPLLLILTMFCCSVVCYAQTTSIDEYKKAFENSSADSILINAYLKMSNDLLKTKPRELLIQSQPLKEKSERTNNSFLQENVYHQMAQAYNNLRKPDSAISLYKKAIDASIAAKDYESQGQITHDLGFCFYQQTILDSSLIYYHKALEIKRQIGKPKPIAATLNGIGLIYRTRNHISAAASYYEEALDIYEKLHDKAALNVMVNIATLYNLQKKYDSATIIFKKVYQTASEYKDENMMFNAQVNMALALNYQEKYAEALPIFKQLVDNPRVKQIEEINNAVQYGLGQSYFGVKDYEKAISILKNCLTLRYRNTKYQSLAAITHLLYLAEKNRGNYSQALEYYEQLKIYSDSLSNISRTSLIEELNTKYKASQKEQQILLLNKENEVKDLSLKEKQQSLLLFQSQNKQKEQQILLLNKEGELKDVSLREQNKTLQLSESQNKQKAQQITLLNKENEVKDLSIKDKQKQLWLYALGLGIVTIIAAAAFVLYRSKQKTSKQLQEKNNIITHSLNDKEILLKEIHHRVKNNLQVISSLLNLQTKNISDEKALEAIKEGRDRVRSMALIHQNLYQEDNLTGVDVKEYIEKLTRSLISSYNIQDGEIELKTDIDKLQLDVDTVVPLGLILNELISNALKYAFDEKVETSALTIKLKQENNALLLQVKDNGKGLPAGWSLENIKSMGYQIIKSFAQKMKAELKVEGSNGTDVQMIIAKYKLTV